MGARGQWIMETSWGAGKGTRMQEAEVGVDAYYTMKTRQEGAKEEMTGGHWLWQRGEMMTE